MEFFAEAVPDLFEALPLFYVFVSAYFFSLEICV